MPNHSHTLYGGHRILVPQPEFIVGCTDNRGRVSVPPKLGRLKIQKKIGWHHPLDLID